MSCLVSSVWKFSYLSVTIFHLILLWLDNILGIVSVLLNFLRFVLWPRIWSLKG